MAFEQQDQRDDIHPLLASNKTSKRVFVCVFHMDSIYTHTYLNYMSLIGSSKMYYQIAQTVSHNSHQIGASQPLNLINQKHFVMSRCQ